MPVPSQGHYGFHSFPVLTDFVCLYTYEFWFPLCKIVRSSVILLLPLFNLIFCFSLLQKQTISYLLLSNKFEQSLRKTISILILLLPLFIMYAQNQRNRKPNNLKVVGCKKTKDPKYNSRNQTNSPIPEGGEPSLLMIT
jgi:hypothetical protein